MKDAIVPFTDQIVAIPHRHHECDTNANVVGGTAGLQRLGLEIVEHIGMAVDNRCDAGHCQARECDGSGDVWVDLGMERKGRNHPAFERIIDTPECQTPQATAMIVGVGKTRDDERAGATNIGGGIAFLNDLDKAIA